MKKEIVFSPSTYGSLRVAQYAGIGDYPKNWGAGLPQRIMEEQIEKWNNSRPIGGRSSDILCLEYNLAFGDISEKVPSDKRYQFLHDSISKMYPADQQGDLADEWVQDIKKRNQKNLKELRKAIKDGSPIRVWYSSVPDELSSYYWLMSFLDKQKYYTNISAIYIPPDYWQGNYFCRGTGMMGFEMFYDAQKFEKIISEEQIKAYSKRWQQLQKENAPMRLMISGNLVSLPEDFLDSFIYRTIEKMPETFAIAKLVGDVMGEYELGVGDMPIFERVLYIINKGDLKLTEKWQDRPMATCVKKSVKLTKRN